MLCEKPDLQQLFSSCKTNFYYGEKIYLVIVSYLGWLEKFIAFFSAFME